jgi:hypothetical protein
VLAVKEELQRRLASNENMFRRVNEGIERGQWPDQPDSAIGFRCECARLGCNTLLGLTLSRYERVRANPRRFVMLRGHEMPDLEMVVEELDSIVIVEKTGEAGVAAEAGYPRSAG